jgi:hypothetical protein
MVLIDCFAKTNQEVVKADTHGALKQIDMCERKYATASPNIFTKWCLAKSIFR